MGRNGNKMIDTCLSLQKQNSSSLFLAIINQHEDIVKLLSANPKIDINQETWVNDGTQIPEKYLITAICVGNNKIIQYLISNPNLKKDDIYCSDPLATNDYINHIDPQFILPIDRYDPIVTVFQTALQKRNKEVVQFYLENLKID